MVVGDGSGPGPGVGVTDATHSGSLALNPDYAPVNGAATTVIVGSSIVPAPVLTVVFNPVLGLFQLVDPIVIATDKTPVNTNGFSFGFPSDQQDEILQNGPDMLQGDTSELALLHRAGAQVGYG